MKHQVYKVFISDKYGSRQPIYIYTGRDDAKKERRKWQALGCTHVQVKKA